jgi:hypothetical protein
MTLNNKMADMSECPFKHENIKVLYGVEPMSNEKLPKICTCGAPLTYADEVIFVRHEIGYESGCPGVAVQEVNLTPIMSWTKDGAGQIHESGAYVEHDEKGWWAYPDKSSWVAGECASEDEAKSVAIKWWQNPES